MDALEASCEILKTLTSNDEFNQLDFEEKREKVLETFEMIYRRIRETKTDVTLTNLPNKLQRLHESYNWVSSIQEMNQETLASLQSVIRDETMSCRG